MAKPRNRNYTRTIATLGGGQIIVKLVSTDNGKKFQCKITAPTWGAVTPKFKKQKEAEDLAWTGVASWAIGVASPVELLDLACPGLSTPKIADLLGVPQSTASDWRNDKSGMSKAVRTHCLRIMGLANGTGWHRV